ncbi:MAG: hypothetical protein WCB11_13535 [Terriglobales bacterium]|jgi:hypothetical protein
MRPAHVLVILLYVQCLGTAQETTTYIGHYLEPFPGPQVYKNPSSGTLFYVETDGRHVSAISSEGKLLWSKDPFKDAHLPFYRTEKLQIIHIGPAPKGVHPHGEESSKFVSIVFNSSQSGLLRMSNGDFEFLGQD